MFSDPVELPFGTRLAQGSVERLDVTGASVEFLGAEQRHQTAVGASDHARHSCADVEDILGSVITVEGPEPDLELIATAPPIGPFSEQPVGDLAQCAVRSARLARRTC